MSDTMILDGTGNGIRAKVSQEKRLFVSGEDFTGSLIATLSGFTFSFASGAITLTSANTSALLYVKNNYDIGLIIESVRFQAFDSTGGAGGIPTWTLLKNPTAGTIISGGTAASPSNANFGSNNTVDVTLMRGAEGLTFTDGVVHANIFGDKIPGRVTIENAEFCVPRGSSVGLRVTPPAGNTLWTVSAGFRGYFSTSLD
jgi:hypothetical protein